MIKVLHLASWYPSNIKPLEGIFVKKQIEAVSQHCLSYVLYITLNPELSKKPYLLETYSYGNVTTMIVYAKQSKYKIRFIAKLITIKNFSKGLFSALSFIRKIIGLPTIVNLHIASRLGIIALLYKYLYGIPYVIIEHSSFYIEKKLRSCNKDKFEIKINNFRDKFIYNKASKVITVSQFLANTLKERFNLQTDFHVIPNVVDVPNENIIGKKKQTGKIVALTVAILQDDVKRISETIKAFVKVFNSKKNLELHIVGDGKDRLMLEKTAEASQLLNTKIFFHGAIENEKMFLFYQSAHFFVLNSLFETFSVVTAESLSFGVPVLISKCGGPEEYINNELGILYDKFDESALRNGIEFMYEHWNNYSPLKLRKFVIDHFSKDIVGKRIFEVYKQCLNL